MNALPYGAPEEEYDEHEEQPTFMLPGRPRRNWWGPATALLLAAAVGAGCFYAGVRVEKSKAASSASTSGSGLAARLSALAGGATGRTSATGTSRAGGGSALGGGGFLARFGGGNASIGTVASISGHNLYLTDTSGNTVKVVLSSATKITKSLDVSSRSLHPGDSIVVQGLKGSNGTISATSVSDSGTGGAGGFGASGSGASATSGSGGGGNSAVNSLFGSGG